MAPTCWVQLLLHRVHDGSKAPKEDDERDNAHVEQSLGGHDVGQLRSKWTVRKEGSVSPKCAGTADWRFENRPPGTN
eukprot:353716-Chlamydomonas_euryale.AAC.10